METIECRQVNGYPWGGQLLTVYLATMRYKGIINKGVGDTPEVAKKNLLTYISKKHDINFRRGNV